MGLPHHVVLRGNDRQIVFFSRNDRILFLEFIESYSAKNGCNILSYCLMPNHIHLLAQPRNTSGLGKMMHGIAFRYAQRFNWKHDRTGRVWGSRYYSCVVCSQDYLWAAVRYIEFNPVRSGISEKPDDYLWSSARARITDQKNPIVNDPDGLVASVVKPGEVFDVTEDELAEIRSRTRRGIPLGISGARTPLSVRRIKRFLKSSNQNGIDLITR